MTYKPSIGLEGGGPPYVVGQYPSGPATDG
ncbi:MAG: hypothetical protein Ct9H300mP4_06570 [Gammaproteobacteria bacterium]|nr:MAG: hypothetical protein Ct9H300mP4_06570 [Gammaproteobacteria bacterium]